MRSREFITELKIDNRQGLGAVPHNADVDYFGLRTVMRPSMFLKLSLPLDKNSPDEQATIQHLRKQINDQGFGAPLATALEYRPAYCLFIAMLIGSAVLARGASTPNR